ncbi:LOW QUALITY PROTEIN: hypothetical protein CRUP_018357 [Coryphaenoides rupestris]|nr:LOW QUALITY PROTEIN: hypothetical protein CRUP_018357 [Coryphaenoides rupestris]
MEGPGGLGAVCGGKPPLKPLGGAGGEKLEGGGRRELWRRRRRRRRRRRLLLVWSRSRIHVGELVGEELLQPGVARGRRAVRGGGEGGGGGGGGRREELLLSSSLPPSCSSCGGGGRGRQSQLQAASGGIMPGGGGQGGAAGEAREEDAELLAGGESGCTRARFGSGTGPVGGRGPAAGHRGSGWVGVPYLTTRSTPGGVPEEEPAGGGGGDGGRSSEGEALPVSLFREGGRCGMLGIWTGIGRLIGILEWGQMSLVIDV